MAPTTKEASAALLASAFERWPRLAAASPSFSSAVDDAIHNAVSESAEPEKLRAGLVLACALAAGDSTAMLIFEQTFMPKLRAALCRTGIGADLVDDALQVVRFRLLVATDNRDARIVTYRGRSSLERWLYVVAIREARALAGRARARATTDLELAKEVVANDGDLEAEYLARTHREAFSTALGVAFAKLSSKDRLLIRLDVLEGLNDGEIAKVFDVHRTTALRWVAQATNRLIVATKATLSEELSMQGSELDSLLRGFISHLDLSLGRMLAETPHHAVA